ncbi:MAG: tetratricopeptide repeat protein [Pseudomonadota bacterium]
MAKQKISRKKLLKEPDEFITVSARLFQFIVENKPRIQWGLMALVGIALILSAWMYWVKQTEKKAVLMLGNAMISYEPDEKNKTSEASYAKVAETLEALIGKYPGTDSGKIGKVLYGGISLKMGNPDKAIELYRRALDDFDSEPSLRNIIQSGLGHAYLAKKEIKEAKRCFEKTVSGNEPVLKDEALFILGNLYGQEGDMKKKSEMYEKILSDFPNSLYSAIVKEEGAIR